MIRVRNVEASGRFRLRAVFSDGTAGELDFAPVVAEAGEMTKSLRDESIFAQVRIERGVPTWPNGFDVSPAWLRHEMERAGTLQPPIAA